MNEPTETVAVDDDFAPPTRAGVGAPVTGSSVGVGVGIGVDDGAPDVEFTKGCTYARGGRTK